MASAPDRSKARPYFGVQREINSNSRLHSKKNKPHHRETGNEGLTIAPAKGRSVAEQHADSLIDDGSAMMAGFDLIDGQRRPF